MAIVNLSIPQDLKDEFEKVFRGRNKSALIVELMRQAIACERRHGAHAEAIDDILMTGATPPFDDDISISHSQSQVPR
jgi:metal-responsive CopG/Arc/MetJ family transcriptional regulator